MATGITTNHRFTPGGAIVQINCDLQVHHITSPAVNFQMMPDVQAFWPRHFHPGSLAPACEVIGSCRHCSHPAVIMALKMSMAATREANQRKKVSLILARELSTRNTSSCSPSIENVEQDLSEEGMSVTLHKHQRMAQNWMLLRENNLRRFQAPSEAFPGGS
ncbi:hypothetical protein PAHAL_7G301100 [Panicum hallii]|uniref:Uncharacterized protein n=1 Tax=Panicum hallii TaxID=206008 RepID=A0A2T8IDX7_9POAL|nr:hypothetical protein PAHAL_7G301100 [Panicum hallii]